MSKLVESIKHEVRELLPAWIYFFITFQAIAFTQTLLLRTYNINTSTFISATIGSLLAAKVVLVAGFLPFLQPFPEIPIIYNVLWKTSIYWLVGIGFQVLEHTIFHGGFASTLKMLSQPHFWIVQFWLVILLFVWCNAQQVIHIVGLEEVKRIYLGISSH
jgi:predicted membrane protein